MPEQPYTGSGKGSAHPFIKAVVTLFTGKEKGLREGRGRVIGDVGPKGKHRKKGDGKK